MTKIQCENCGRKVTVDGDEHVVQKRFCPRCGTEFPDRD
jgi:ribosomal protein S27AE